MSRSFWPEGPYEREALRFVLTGLAFVLFLSGAALWSLRLTTLWALDQVEARLAAQADAVAAGLGPERPALLAQAGTLKRLQELGARQAALYRRDGLLLEHAGYLPGAAAVPNRIPREEMPEGPSPRVSRAAAAPGEAVVTVATDRGALLRVVFDASALEAARRNLALLTAVIPVGAVLLVVLFVPFFRRILTPLHELSRTAQRAGGLLDAPAAAPPPAAEAVATFARTINELRQRSGELEELRQREKARADALARTYDTLIRLHPGGLLVVGADGRLTEASPPARRALTLGPEALGQPASEALASVPELVSAVSAALAGQPTLSREVRSGTAPGGRVLAVTAVPVAQGDGRRLGTLVFLDDLSSMKALERELALKREMAALGEMSAGIAHEFRNATATILGYARLAASARDEGDRSRYLDGVRAEAEHIVKVTGDFLLFARPERVARRPVSLSALVDEVVAEEQMASQETALSTEGPFGEVDGDAALLRRALVNLVRNACQAAASAGGTPRVAIRGGTGEDGSILLLVEDSGPGVPESRLAKLFVPFATTKEGGTGLGLSLVGKIVALHGGNVRVERSAALGGAAFVVSLPPRAGVSPGPGPSPPPGASPPPS